MSQQHEPDHIDLASEPEKFRTLTGICSFISKEIAKCTQPEPKEGLVIALQCLENAFGINYDNIKGTPNIPDFMKLVMREITGNEEAESFKQKGNDLMASGSFNEAVYFYTKAININPENPVYYCNRAAAHYSARNYLGSVADCISAGNIDPTYVESYGRLGLACLSLNPAVEAASAYEIALILDPQNSTYKDNYKIAKQRCASNMQTFSQMVNSPAVRSVETDLLRGNDSVRGLADLMHSMLHRSGGSSPEAIKIMTQQILDQIQQRCLECIETAPQSEDAPSISDNQISEDQDMAPN